MNGTGSMHFLHFLRASDYAGEWGTIKHILVQADSSVHFLHGLMWFGICEAQSLTLSDALL